MPTYYEILKIHPTAPPPEIESAYEAQYHHWRRLVTHHDPTVVNKANQALQALEQIRATLTDPVKRAAYDAKLGLQGPVGGLTDPQASAPAATPVPPRPVVVAPPIPDSMPHAPTRTDAWICPQCGTTNPVQSRFCKKCGQTLGINCPKCNTIIEATAVFCAVCGGNIRQLTEQKQRRAELIDAQQKLTAQQVQVQQAIHNNRDEFNVLRRVAVSAIAWIGWLPMWSSAILYDAQNYNNRSEHFIVFLITGVLGLLLTLTSVIALKKLTFSALVIGASSLLEIAGFVDPYGDYYYIPLYAAWLYVVNILWFGGKLTKYGAWVWILVIAIFASGGINIDNLSNYDGNLILRILVPAIVSIISLGIIALRAWLLSRHLKLEQETSELTSHTTLERIDHELQQITQELALLDVKY